MLRRWPQCRRCPSAAPAAARRGRPAAAVPLSRLEQRYSERTDSNLAGADRGGRCRVVPDRPGLADR